MKKGRVRNFLKSKGKSFAGNLLKEVGGDIPIAGRFIEAIGEVIAPSVELTSEEVAKIENLIADRDKELTARWVSDNSTSLKLPRIVRPIILIYAWIITTLIVVLEACAISMPSTSIILGMIGAVNAGYFGLVTYEKKRGVR